MADFKIEGLEEFQEKLKTIERKAPDRIIDKLDDEGKELRNNIRKNMAKETGSLRKGVKLLPVEKVRGGWQKPVVNEAPHYHLVEHGHRMVVGGALEDGKRNRGGTGRVVGWVPGRFYLERTVKEQEEPIMEELENWLEDLFQELK
jgi:hypothetical protein